MTRSLYLSALLNLSKIHDALTTSLCTTQPLKDPWRAHYISLHYSDSESYQINDSIYLLENIKAAFCRFSLSLQIHDALNEYVGEHIKAALSRFSESFQIHDALNISVAEQHYSCISKALPKLSNPWRTQYICCITTLLQIHDALHRSHYSQTILIRKSLKSMTRSLYLLENNIIAAFRGSLKAFKSMTRSIYLLQDNIIVAFSRLSQSFQICDALNISVAVQLYSKSVTRSIEIIILKPFSFANH